MPRPLRIEFEGAWYHVMNRGTNRQRIFKTNNHREIFLSLLEEITQKFFVEIHAYCLMDNHYHLLMHTPLPNLGRSLRHLDGVYTQRFNRSEKRDGSLFRGRYKAILIEADNYLLQVSRYIHLNPIEAKLCHYPDQYKWSSFQFYARSTEKQSWLNTSFILNYFYADDSPQQYVQFVNQGIDYETSHFYKKKYLHSIFGSKKFINDKLTEINEEKKRACSPDIKILQNIPTVEKIIKSVAEYFVIDIESIKKRKSNKKNLPRIIAIYLSRKIGQITHQKISENFSLRYESMGRTLKRCEEAIQENVDLKNHVDNLIVLICG